MIEVGIKEGGEWSVGGGREEGSMEGGEGESREEWEL